MGPLRDGRFRARIEIVTGFAVAAVGALTGFGSWVSEGNLSYSSRYDVEECASVLGFLAAVAAWFFLTQFAVDASNAQRVVLRRALACFVAEEACVAVSSLVITFNVGAVSWSGVGNTLVGAGALLCAVGFFSMMLTYRDRVGEPTPLISSGELS